MASLVPPNILVCGTPGTGKSTLCGELAERLGLRYISVSDLAKSRSLHAAEEEEAIDAVRDTIIIDEDKVIDELEDPSDINIKGGGVLVEYHACDFFPERFFQLVCVLRTDNTKLWNRLESRGYSFAKVQENVTAEIMQVLLEEARDSYAETVVAELPSDSPEDMQANVDAIVAWTETYASTNGDIMAARRAMVQAHAEAGENAE